MKEKPLDLGEPQSAVAYDTTARVYHVRWPHTWAIAVVHDASGCLSLVTDYGNWSHRWSQAGLGDRTLHTFLARAGADYVLRKVMDSKQREVFSKAKTVASLRDAVCQRRREGACTREEAREAWEALDGWDPELDADDCPDYAPREVAAIVRDAWEYGHTEESTSALAFRTMWPELRKLIAATAGIAPGEW